MERKMRQAVFSLLWLTIALEVHADWLTINSIPADAVVIVNDRETGYTPLRLDGQTGDTIVLTVQAELLKTVRLEHVFNGNKTIYLDLHEGVEIDEDTYWQKKTAEVQVTEKTEEKTETESMEALDETFVSEGEAVTDAEQTMDVSQEPIAESDNRQDEGIKIAPLQGRTAAVLISIPDPADLTDPLDTDDSAGELILDVTIKNNGSVSEVGFVTEPPSGALKDYLVNWLKKWAFQAATDAGNPIESSLKIKVVYDLSSGEFSFPTYDKVSHAGKPGMAVTEVAPEPTETPVPDVVKDETVYFTESQVDEKALVFSPPNMGNIPLEIINLNMKGTAKFKVFIKPDGSVARVSVVDSTGSQKLDEYIVPMILKSFWEPAKKNGNPVSYQRDLSLEYYTTACKFQFFDLE
ncbi:energy transducer TonB [bacterium]|nr:energy transducer TonB [candidate division CSSED10-310 bacterium]